GRGGGGRPRRHGLSVRPGSSGGPPRQPDPRRISVPLEAPPAVARRRVFLLEGQRLAKQCHPKSPPLPGMLLRAGGTKNSNDAALLGPGLPPPELRLPSLRPC